VLAIIFLAHCHPPIFYFAPHRREHVIWNAKNMTPYLPTYSATSLYDVHPKLVTWYLGVKHQWTRHACDILDIKIHLLDIPNCKKSINMHNMIISHLICEANGKAMPACSKQNTQTDYVANKYMLYRYYWLQSVKIFYFLCYKVEWNQTGEKDFHVFSITITTT
jgi:hypothetical protein